MDDLLEISELTNETYMILDDAPPTTLDEDDALEYLGTYLTWAFYEAKDRMKGKGKGKNYAKGKHGSGNGKFSRASEKGKRMPGTFGVYVYGSYVDPQESFAGSQEWPWF